MSLPPRKDTDFRCTANADQSIADTKVVPPRGARRLVPRESLMLRLQEVRRQRCVVIQGPAGCGKTSTLLAWRRELLAMNFEVAWLSLAAEDDELGRFCHCLQASLSEVLPEQVRDAGVLLGRDNQEMAVEHWVITLVQGIAQHSRELVLMLDDMQHLQDPRIIQALQWLLDYAPSNLHLVFGTRTALPIPLAGLRARGQVSEFDLRDLRFNPAESERFLREHLGAIDPRDAAQLHELTDGWVAGLQLFAVDLKAKQVTRVDQVQIRDAAAFADYFEREVLVRLEPEDLRLLTCVSICERFCASLCATLLGQPQAIAGMMTQLARLDGDNLFITQVKSHDRETWYRLHPLLGSVLRARLASRPQQEQVLHVVARGWFTEHDHLDEAVRHAVKAGDAEVAADIVEACAYDLLAKGNLSQIAGLLKGLPAEQTAERFGLQVVMAHLQLYSRNFQGLQQTLQHLQSHYEKLDRRQRHSLTVLKGSQAIHQDDTAAMLAILPELLAIPTDADDFAWSGRGNTLAWLYMYQGEFEKAREILECGERPFGSPRRSLLGRCMSGMSLALEGRATQAEHLYREVLEEAEKHGVAYLVVSTMAAGLLGTALYEQGDYEAACHLLERRMKLLEQVAIPDTVLQCIQTLAMAHWLAGRQTEALSWLDRLERYATRYDLGRLLVSALVVRMRWLQQTGDETGAENALQRILQTAQQHDALESGTPLEVRTIARRATLERHLHAERFSEATELLPALIEVSQSNRRWRRVVAMRVQMAVVEQGRGRPVDAHAQFVEALRQGHRLGLVRSVLDAWSGVPSMLEATLADNTLDPVLRFYAQRLLDIAGSTVAGNQQDASAESASILSVRELDVLGLVAQALPNKKIARVLNLSPETVKWHMKNIFYKLEVTGRDEAIAKVRDLELKLPGHPPV
ncbi:LuxR C-terminal-related transcriptional regulator [Pseudomonas azerbaijanoccidens]|uniref:LuxR C-terminal-related transcriptional regulator n=1 Tax=Pseudomonas azerbaijanoccidentalis TaxID=2842347 RepID=UPI00200AD639|nr:LuxR C-terminal-related transcriptional regulator [Pseudomonas azerbaijanoccidentalis]MCK8663543.1 LuxR C-terminal-related transcriptional regulator [Pseudomonas azerbaijanoccidentalis]